MDIWTERLEERHLPILEKWVGRISVRITPNDLPQNPAELPAWYKDCTSEIGRVDCLISLYETPVGISGLRNCDTRAGTGEFYLMLGESNYNPLRVAAYAALQMLDRAFQECGYDSVSTHVFCRCVEYLKALEKMGFTHIAEKDEMICAEVRKQEFLSRKYLF